MLAVSFIGKETEAQDIPAGPVVKTLPSIAAGEGLIPGWGTKIHMPF